MVVHQVFAHILDTQIKNVIVCDNYEVANQLARAIYGDNAIAVECTQYPCGIGDFYVDNTFHYRDKDDPTKVADVQGAVAENTVDIEVLKALAGIDDTTASDVAANENNTETTTNADAATKENEAAK